MTPPEKQPPEKSPVVTSEAKGSEKKKKPQKPQEGFRETKEAVAIAFILAFVFKTFEAEAFVIPTGSMAPTLYGRHKEVDCPGCGFAYTVGASQEINQDSGVLYERRIRVSTCPNCRRVNDILDAPVFNGDRIVVNKQVSKYRRFDVVVFKNPEEPHVNYIKRLVGLPGEIVRIRQGDIQTKLPDGAGWVTQRKEDPNVQRAIQLPIYDDAHPPTELLKAGAEERWAPAEWDENDSDMGGWPRAANSWTADSGTRSYSVASTDNSPNWLRYRHLAADEVHWNSVRLGTLSPALTCKLIGDFCGFNAPALSATELSRLSDFEDQAELYWVKDLTLDCSVDLQAVSAESSMTFEISQGSRSIRLVVQPETGSATVELVPNEGLRQGPPEVLATVETPLKGTGKHSICLAFVDDRVCLWVDDELIDFGTAADLPSPELNLPTKRDLAPIGIAANQMTATFSDLVVRRDIYYRNDLILYEDSTGRSIRPRAVTEVDDYNKLATSMREPDRYAANYQALVERQERLNPNQLQFVLADDEYLMFGDNSPASKDSRLFDYESRPMRGISSHRYAVKEKDLIGEALCIFWPHGVPFMNEGKGYTLIGHRRYQGNQIVKDRSYPLYSVPFYPNLSRMKRIR